MKPLARNWLMALAALLAFCAALSAGAQGDPYAGLRSFDGQDRRPVMAVRKLIREAGKDQARLLVIEKALVRVVQDAGSTPAARQEAATFLGEMGSAASVPALTRMLAQPAATDVARYALERIPGPQAAAALRAAARQATGTRRAGLVASIGNRGDPEAVALLAGLARSADPPAAQAAAEALGKVGTPAAVAALRKLPRGSVVTGQALARAAGRLAAAGKAAEARAAYAECAAQGRPAEVRLAGLLGLIETKSPQAAAVGLAFLRSSSPYLGPAAARAVATRLGAPVQARVRAAWPGLAGPVQAALVAAWGDRGDTAAADLALGAAASADPVLRAAGIRAAARLAGARAVPALGKALAAGDGEDRRAARESLAAMGGQAADAAIIALTRDADAGVRSAAMGVLAQRDTAVSRRVVLEAAQGTDPAAASAALRALQASGGPGVYRDVVGVLFSTGDEGVRDAAAAAVVGIGRRLGDAGRATEPVLAALPSANAAARAAALGALAELGGDAALAALTRAASDPDVTVRRAAIAGLAEVWSDDRPAASLLEVARRDAELSLRVAALRGVVRLVDAASQAPADQKVARLAEVAAAAERPDEKRAVLGALRSLRVPASVELAAGMLGSPDLFGDAADTLFYLAERQRRDNRNLEAVRGPAVTAAMDRIAAEAADESVKARARALR